MDTPSFGQGFIAVNIFQRPWGEVMRVFQLTAILCLILSSTVAEASYPNILFVLTDDQAPWAIGASGNPLAKTPHMEWLLSV